MTMRFPRRPHKAEYSLVGNGVKSLISATSVACVRWVFRSVSRPAGESAVAASNLPKCSHPPPISLVPDEATLSGEDELGTIRFLVRSPCFGVPRPLDKHQDLSKIGDTRRLQLLINAIVDYAIYMIDVDGTVRSWNSGAEKLKGYSADEIIGKPFSLFYMPEDRANGLPQTALKIAAEAGRFSSEGWRIRKDGSRFWALVVIDAIRDEEGRADRLCQGDTRYHGTSAGPRRTYWRASDDTVDLVEAVVDYAIFQFDPDGNVATWNPGARRIKGYAPEEIIGRALQLVLYPGGYRNLAFRNGHFPRLPNTADSRRKAGEYEKTAARFWASVVIDASRDEAATLLDLRKSLGT